MEPLDFDKAVEQIVDRDRRFNREAYAFVRDALDYTQKNVARTVKEGLRHVTGQELLEGIRAYALHVYGPMALLVLGEWGIHRCEDFGDIVFNLIESGLFAKTDRDNREDFKGGYLFDEAFKKPFVPNVRADMPPERASLGSSERQSESVDPA